MNNKKNCSELIDALHTMEEAGIIPLGENFDIHYAPDKTRDFCSIFKRVRSLSDKYLAGGRHEEYAEILEKHGYEVYPVYAARLKENGDGIYPVEVKQAAWDKGCIVTREGFLNFN